MTHTAKTNRDLDLEKLIRAKAEENVFVRSRKSYYASDGDPSIDYNTSDYGLSFYYAQTLEQLKKAFLNFQCLRQVLIYKDLVFINSTLGGGWEAWTLKRFGNLLIGFESISMELIIESGTYDGKTFEQYIEELNNLTQFQVEHYLELPTEAK